MTTNVNIYSGLRILTRNEPAAMLRSRGWKLCLLGDKEGITEPNNEEYEALLFKYAPEITFFIADTHPVPGDFFQKAPKLRQVLMFGVGLNHIDIAAATKAGVIVSNAPGANARSVAELVVGCMFALARRMMPMQSALLRGEWQPCLGAELLGKTLGIAGFGHIGQALAAQGKALGMKVIFHNRSPRPELAASMGCTQVDFPTLLRESDFFSLNMPALPGDAHFLGAAELAAMKPTAFLINTGRGSLVDLEALAAALAEKRLAGAGLDVYPKEPFTLDDMKAMAHPLYDLPNVVALPHVGAATADAVNRVARLCFEDIDRALRGEPCPHAANPEVYGMRK